MKRAVIYARFSSSGQREESIEGQVRECTAYAGRRNYTIVAQYADRALTGTNDQRPEFQRMIADAASGSFDLVICWKHDRFARNRYDAAFYKSKLKKAHVDVEYAAETVPPGPEGILMDSLMEGIAEYYSANLSQQVKRGLYDSALKRQMMGNRMFGFVEAEDGRYAIDPVTGPIVRRIFEEYAAGVPAKAILDELNGSGVRSVRGAKFGKNFIARVISNEKYKGVYAYADIYDEHGIPAIVDPVLFDRANAALHARKRAPNSKQVDDGYLLTGKLYCGHCESMMTAGGGVNSKGVYYKYYACNGRRYAKNGCKKHAVDKAWIEDAVVQILVSIVHSDEVIEMFASRYEEWQAGLGTRAELEAARGQLDAVSRKVRNLAEKIAERPSDALMDLLEAEEKKKAELAEQVAKLEYDAGPRFGHDEVVWFLERFRDGDVDDDRWRAFLVQTFLQRAYLFDDGRLLLQLNYSGSCDTISVDALESAVRDCPLLGRLMVPTRTETVSFGVFVVFVAPLFLARTVLSVQ